MTHIKDLLCSRGFGNIWRDQSVVNEKLFLANFEQRLKDRAHIQKRIGDMNSSNKCRKRTEKLELFTNYKCENYIDCNIRHDLNYMLKLSSSNTKH